MNSIAHRCALLLKQCDDVLLKVGGKNYQEKQNVLSGSSIGMHYRHVLEFFLLLKEGGRELCYDDRKRDPVLESELEAALSTSRFIQQWLEQISKVDSLIQLEWRAGDESRHIPSSLERELAYNLEHLVHHMALIRVGIVNRLPHLQIPDDFGVAYSTQAYRKQQA